MKCCICQNEIDIQYNENGEIVWDQGHNADPVAEGRCCTACNWLTVVPTRLRRMSKKIEAITE